MKNTDQDAQVLIVGAGPVGLALATELAMRGKRSRIIEKNLRTGLQPRAKTTNIRTMTHMRRWGLAAEMRRRSPLSADFPRDVAFRTGLFDEPIYTFQDAFCATPKRYDAFPEHAEFIPQYVVESILAEHVAEHPLVDLSFGVELVDFQQSDTGVTARIKDVETGEEQTLNADWLVGADGGRSKVRKSVGVEMRGERDIVSCVTLIMRVSGLGDDPDLKRALFHWIIDADAACFFGPMDRDDLWYWSKVAPRETPTQTLLQSVAKAIGRDYPVEVVARDEWMVHSLIADRYREGRVFLVGDACHLHSPFGGHGMNLGVGDAVDLGWKLAAVLDGWGGDALLDSYTLERQQAHRAVVKSATKNVASLSDDFVDPDLSKSTPAGEAARRKAAKAIKKLKTPEFQSVGLVLGNAYSNSPAIVDEPGPKQRLNVSRFSPTARPGHLAPHVWLDDETSLYDLFSSGFTLLRLGACDAQGEKALLAGANERGAPLAIVPIQQESALALYGANYALIRPDQHVAWRGDAAPSPRIVLDITAGARARPSPKKASAAKTKIKRSA